MDNQRNIDELIARARAAQRKIENYSQQQIDEVCLSVGWQVYKDDNIAACAKIAVEETGMGVYEDKIKKHKVKVLGVCKGVVGRKTDRFTVSTVSYPMPNGLGSVSWQGNHFRYTSARTTA